MAIEYLRVNECGVSQEKAPLATLVIYSSSNIELVDSLFVCQYQQCGLVLANIAGRSHFINITINFTDNL